MSVFDQNESKDYLSELVGEGKKYKDVSELAKAYINLDAHTKVIQSENREFRTQEEELVQRQKTLEANVAKLLETASKTNIAPPVNEGKPVQSAVETLPPVKQDILGPSQLKKLVLDAIQETNTEKERKSNLELVDAEAVKIFGSLEKANEFVKNKAAELNLNIEDMAVVAMKSPKAFFEILNIANKGGDSKSRSAITDNPVNSRGALNLGKPAIEDDTKWEFYQNLRRTDSNKYYSGEVQAKIHKLVMDGVMALPR